jgi:N-acyl-D-amino-acid deacylase
MLNYLIKGGTIFDGTGRRPFKGDIGITGDRIVEIGNLKDTRSEKTIDAEGLVVAPGFIDIHSHHDLYVIDQNPIDRFESFIRQGVTTCVVGNCGWSPAPCKPENKNILLDLIRSMGVPVESLYWETMDEYLVYLENQGLICNMAQLVGHNAVRIAVMGSDHRFCTPEESAKMAGLIRQSLDAGCVGFSSGLMYYPGMYAHTEELLSLAKVLNDFQRPYATHLRGYCTTLENSVEEALTIAEASEVPLQISHLHAVPFLGKFSNFLYELVNFIEALNAIIPLPPLPNPALSRGFRRIQAALDRGTDVGMDIVPYTLGNTTATVLFPPWANRNGKSGLLAHLRNSETR